MQGKLIFISKQHYGANASKMKYGITEYSSERSIPYSTTSYRPKNEHVDHLGEWNFYYTAFKNGKRWYYRLQACIYSDGVWLLPEIEDVAVTILQLGEHYIKHKAWRNSYNEAVRTLNTAE